jgi:hypothetical protein
MITEVDCTNGDADKVIGLSSWLYHMIVNSLDLA